MGAARAAVHSGRARHRVHRPGRRPARPGPGRRSAPVSGQPARRLRRRRDAPGLRHLRGPGRAGHVGARPGDRRGHRGRGGVAGRHAADVHSPGHVARRARGKPARWRRALVRRLRDRGREMAGRRRPGAAVLRRAADRTWPDRSTRPRRPAELARAARAVLGPVQGPDQGRVGGRLRRNRRVRRTGTVAARGHHRPAPDRAGDLRRPRRRAPAVAIATFFPDPGRLSEPPPAPGQHTTEALAEWGLADAADLVACGAAIQA